ncbi:hypothetical protein BGZ97_005729 [Linnemannia gamsii]|uniref:PROP1-like PPR domain-containing protein n=1 Tax=Linnemannia gamsii TaxID=64522 RepID=A0A9P6QS36_9FUNG|nr:hypothetical protein BGZ97_005729 [Linnemannia gamsii]
MQAFRSSPKKLRLASGNVGTAPVSWDSQIASRMLRMFCHHQHDLPAHTVRRRIYRMPLTVSRQYSSTVTKPSMADHDIPHHRRTLYQNHTSSSSTTATPNIIPERSKLSITSFLAPSGSEKHSNAYETIADSFIKGSKPDRAAKPFIILDQKKLGSDPVAPMVMLNDAINSRNAKQIWHTYTRLKRRSPPLASRQSLFNSSLYNRMLLCFQATKTAEAAKWARAIYDDMTEHFSPKIKTLNIMLDILTRHEDLNDAIEFFEQNAARYNQVANLKSYNVMIRGLGHSGQMEAARKIYDDMRTGVIPVQPDVVTYSTLMAQYARKGLQMEADAVLDEMFKDKVQPNMWIFNSVIKRFVHQGDYVGAKRTIALMKSSNVQPDVVTYSTLIDGYARDGDEEAIAKIQAEMAANRVYPNARTITSTIKVFARANLDTDIDAQLAGLLKSLPTGEMNELTFGVLVDVYGKRKDLDAAMGIYHHIISKGRTVNDVIVNTLLDGYVNAGQIPAANKIFHDHFTARGIQPSSPWSYNIMISGCCKENRLQDALHYYHQMNKFGIAPDSIVCSRMIQLYLKHHQLDNAQQMMRLMRNAKMTIPVQTFTMLMDYLSNVRDVRGALRYYQEMLDSGIKADVHCYTVLINAQIRAKNFAGCEQAFQQMTKMGIKPSLHTFTSMVHAHSLQGNTERVKEYWEAISYSGLLPDLKAFTALMQHYGQQSNVEMVEHIFKEIDRRRLKVDAITLTTMISAYSSLPRLNLGRIEEISGMLEERELEPNREYFRVLLDTYGRHGLPDRVIKTWKQAKSQDQPLDWVPSTSNLLHLIEACRDRGYMDTLHAIWQSATTIAIAPRADRIPQDPDLHALGTHPESGTFPQDSRQQIPQGPSLIATPESGTTTILAGTGTGGKRRMICPEPEVFTAYLNALLTHNRFGEIERLLEESREMRLMPRPEDFELLFTSLAQYEFLSKELENIRGIVVRRWPNSEPSVDKIISQTRRI